MYFGPDAPVIMKTQAGNAAAKQTTKHCFAPRCLFYSITCIFSSLLLGSKSGCVWFGFFSGCFYIFLNLFCFVSFN